jgi:hypothetical protein
MSSQSTIAFTNGDVASVNATANTGYYVTPGNMLGILLQSSTGAITWSLTIASDNPNLNGQVLVPSSVTGTIFIPLPPQTCTLTVTSKTQDGQNVTSTTNQFFNFQQQSPLERTCRLASNVNVPVLSNANVASLDGATFLALGQRVLLTGQSNTWNNGPYINSAWANLAANLAILIRPPDYLTGQVLVTPTVFEITEGTAWQNSTWKPLGAVNDTAPITVDTTNVAFYPRVITGIFANVASLANVANVPVFSANTFAIATLNAIATNSAANAQTLYLKSVTAGATAGIVQFGFSVTSAYIGGGAYLIQNW